MAKSDIKLLIRADDMGSSWASNEGCLQACLEGVATSIEIMMPCAWVTDAALLLEAYPQIDTGIHLTLTSEWDRYKWRPLTAAKTLTDPNGNFFPLLTPRKGDGQYALSQQCWDIDEVKAEFKAQIELGLRLFPQTSHINSHMTKHFRDFDTQIGDLVAELCAQYVLKNDPLGSTVPLLRPYPKYPIDANCRAEALIALLNNLKGGTYIAVDHPAAETHDMSALGHTGYRDVSQDRASCLQVFKSAKVKAEIERLGIQLISYKDL